jgi:hypothetical protein
MKLGLVLVVACWLFAAGSILAVEQFAEGPVYDGQPLSAWVDEVAALNQLARIADTNNPEVRVMRAIGTNAIPWLLEEMRKQPPAERLGIRPDFHQLRARCGFWALGEKGTPAIQSLLKMLEEQPEYVPSALAGIGAPALPALQQCMTNALSKVPRARSAGNAIGGLYVAIDVERISQSQAMYLLPVIQAWAHSTNRYAAYWADGVLKQLGAAHLGSESLGPNHHLQPTPR